MKKKALITGITGQDGAYLADFLLNKGYEVHGLRRRSSSFNTGRINHIYKDIHEKNNNLFLHYGDMTDASSLFKVIKKIKPDEIYNFAAQSHVQVSFEEPEYTANSDALGALRILEARIKQPERYFTNPGDVKSYLRLQFNNLEHESFRVMFLDNQHGLISLTEMFRGTIDGAAVYPREVVKTALQFNAAAIILAHNHPSGVCEPSRADKAITSRLTGALKLVDIRVLDHIIVGGNDTYSFADKGLM